VRRGADLESVDEIARMWPNWASGWGGSRPTHHQPELAGRHPAVGGARALLRGETARSCWRARWRRPSRQRWRSIRGAEVTPRHARLPI